MCCFGVEWINSRVHECVASCTGAIVATKCIGTSLAADPKVSTLVKILAGAIVIGNGETCSAEAGRPTRLVNAALEETINIPWREQGHNYVRVSFLDLRLRF